VKKSIVVLAAIFGVAASLAGAPPAAAYDSDAYAYAASHMLKSGDVPASLGDFGTGMDFNATQTSGKVFLCFIGEKQYSAPGGAFTFGASFYENKKDAVGNNLMQTVTQYPSATKAISAFETLQKSITNCKGTTSQTWTDDDGSTQTSSSLTTNGRVPGVTEVGVESLFVNQNYLTTSTNAQDRYASDTYTVYTLLNDVIISTSYTTGNLENIPTKQRAKVNQVAFTAIDRWLD
jgi:hypothetical protein